MSRITSIHPLLIVLISGLLTSCGLFSQHKQQLHTTQPTPPLTSPPSNTPHQPTHQTWVFKLDETRSRGRIDLSLDPKGNLLGAKPAADTSVLKGTIHAKMIIHPDGSQQLKITRVELTNTTPLDMPFKWSPLVGKINVHIPTDILKITHHSFPVKPSHISKQQFSMARSHFTVGGNAQVNGSGLILGKAVGTRNIDLTIKKTEPVKLAGTLKYSRNTATLHIPAAVMQDQFDMEGSLLKLKFTGDLTAHAQIR